MSVVARGTPYRPRRHGSGWRTAVGGRSRPRTSRVLPLRWQRPRTSRRGRVIFDATLHGDERQFYRCQEGAGEALRSYRQIQLISL